MFFGESFELEGCVEGMLKGNCGKLVSHLRVSSHMDAWTLLLTRGGSLPCQAGDPRVISFTGKTDVLVIAVWVGAMSLIEHPTDWAG